MCNINDVMGKCTYRKKELIKAIAEREGKLINMYCIHHWRIIWRSYSKLAWVGFEPATTEFRSDALTDWAFWPWVQYVYAIMKTMCPPGYHQNGFVATHHGLGTKPLYCLYCIVKRVLDG